MQKTMSRVLSITAVLVAAVPFRAMAASDAQFQSCQIMAQAAEVRAALVPAMLGNEASFTAIAQGASFLSERPPASPSVATVLDAPHRKNIQRMADVLVQRKNAVLTVHRATKTIRQMSPPLQQAAEALLSAELVNSSAPTRITAATSLDMLSQRLGKSAAEFLTYEGADPEAVFLLGKDIKTYGELLAGLRDGNPQLRLKPSKEPEITRALAEVDRQYAGATEQVERVLALLKDLVTAREAQQQLLAELAALEKALTPACFPQQ
jgi:twitching motility protein PilJ